MTIKIIYFCDSTNRIYQIQKIVKGVLEPNAKNKEKGSREGIRTNRSSNTLSQAPIVGQSRAQQLVQPVQLIHMAYSNALVCITHCPGDLQLSVFRWQESN